MGISGDPYAAVLDLEHWSEKELTKLLNFAQASL
jgi:hypothetical protein